ncbi:ribosomal-processing cysteine protease Prp [Haliovirga abyssi]|uniref:Ribosomal processing cysteine protease Prp n=1 Tax=Haliovirga abyssi TaxID=2996794 RepID=A0AAU9DFN8_9FUSO|nr:ribosomal-processing cysteine protease Prp [Haliovirga abyssi]BDU51023.1 hypothetical protein HLVA_15920 [Haliovirga abyssi]
MIKVTIYRKNGEITGFSGNGHANFEEYGKDIVCSAVSTAMQQAVVGILGYLKLNPKVGNRDGFLKLDLKNCKISEKNRELNAILESMYIMLKEIEKIYPKNLKIIEKEG